MCSPSLTCRLSSRRDGAVSSDAKRVLKDSSIKFKEMPTPGAIKYYNNHVSKKSRKRIAAAAA